MTRAVSYIVTGALWLAIVWYVAVPLAFDAAMAETRGGAVKFVVIK